MMKISKSDFRQFVIFCFVGASNTIISLVVYYILLKISINYLVASSIGYAVGIINGYLLSSKYVFNKKNQTKTLVKFVTVYLSSLIINLLLLSFIATHLGVDKFIAQIPVTFFNVMYNFFINKAWTFKRDK
jgi:putative flippase GtrA